jgi:hypothetical protein
MRVSGEKFIGIFRRNDCGTSDWIAFLTWRLGFRGPYLVRGRTQEDMRGKLKSLDSTVQFYARGRAHGFDAPPEHCEKKQQKRQKRPVEREALGDLLKKHLGGNA